MLYGFNITVLGEKQVNTAFVRLEHGMDDLSEPLGVIGGQIIDAVKGQFATQGARGGRRWQGLSKGYEAWKRVHFPGQPILVRMGGSKGAALNARQALKVSGRRLVYEPPGDAADILGRHQAGEGHLPQRKVIALTGADGRMMERVFAHWVRHLDGRAAWPPAL